MGSGLVAGLSLEQGLTLGQEPRDTPSFPCPGHTRSPAWRVLFVSQPRLMRLDPLQFICPRVGAEENGALSDRRGQEGLTELETVSA